MTIKTRTTTSTYQVVPEAPVISYGLIQMRRTKKREDLYIYEVGLTDTPTTRLLLGAKSFTNATTGRAQQRDPEGLRGPTVLY